MRKVTATEARKRWFRLLDEAAEGEVIVLQRRGRRLVLRREEAVKSRGAKSHPDYRRLLRVPRVDEADRWSWVWSANRALRLTRRSGR
jgi:antitoxin (DNA-binding transcriptional repressor) of toxin-antitoxin stability system